MKILFDSQIFDWQINGGISRYFIELMQRLERSDECEIFFKVVHSYNTYIQGTSWLRNRPLLKKLQFKGKLSALKLINQKINRSYSNRLLKNGTFDIFHPTYYDPYFLKYLGKRPLVLTVYDLTHEKFNTDTAYSRMILPWKKELIQRANHIVSISENTKKDIIEHYDISPNKITTVYLSGGFDFPTPDSSSSMETGLPVNYILFVGSRSGYKNFRGFIEEAAPVMISDDITLVTAGGGAMNTGELNTLKKLGIADKVISFPHVNDIFLQKLYRRALVFVFPSLYEGFGIPVLEAMQCKCPALLSNNSSLPEVGGDAAVYFDPFKEKDMQLKLKDLINDNYKRDKMIAAGIGQLKKFSWDNTAKDHIEVYKKINQ